MEQNLYDLMDWAGIEELVYSEASNPHAMLGPHLTESGLLIQALIPTAAQIVVKIASTGRKYAMELADKFGIRYQEAVRRGGSTNAGRISLIGKAVPVLVLGVPSRYVHSHYNFCAKDDLEAATELAAQVIKGLDAERIRHILRQDIL